MKKFLSILVAFAMALSLFAAPLAQTAKAAAGDPITITSPAISTIYFRDGTSDATLHVATMGDVIVGKTLPAAAGDYVALTDTAGNVVAITKSDTNGGYALQTTNVVRDGKYFVVDAGAAAVAPNTYDTTTRLYDTGGAAVSLTGAIKIYVKWQFVQTQPTTVDTTCANSVVFSGFVKLGGGSTVNLADVVTVSTYYPDGTTLAGTGPTGTDGGWAYSVAINTSNGRYNTVVVDDYDSGLLPIRYAYIDTGTTGVTMSLAVTPTYLYKTTASQVVSIYLAGTSGGMGGMSGSITSSPAYTTITDLGAADGGLKGVYNLTFNGLSGSAVVNITFAATGYSTVAQSILVSPLDTTSCDFNPNEYISMPGTGEQTGYLYYKEFPNDTLSQLVPPAYPVTIGTFLPITEAWYYSDGSSSPYNKMLLVKAPGTISDTMYADHDYSYSPVPNTDGGQYNQCCSPCNPVKFVWGTVNNCAVTVTPTAVTVGSTSDISVKIGVPTSNDSTLSCNCTVVVHVRAPIGTMFVTSTGVTTADLWYNPYQLTAGSLDGLLGTYSDDQIKTTDPLNVIAVGDTVTFKNITFHKFANVNDYKRLGISPSLAGSSTSASSRAHYYNVSVEVFSTQTFYNKCTNTNTVTHPLSYHNPGAISVNLQTATLPTTIVSSIAGATTMVAGVTEKLDFAPPSVVSPVWREYWADNPIYTLDPVNYYNTNNAFYPVSKLTDTLYESVISPAFNRAGTAVFELLDAYSGVDATTKYVANVTVVLPTFTVTLGLSNGETIANDHVLTEGVKETIYTTAVDPRDGTTPLAYENSLGNIESEATDAYGYPVAMGVLAEHTNDCYLPTTEIMVGGVCGSCSPVTVVALDNPNLADDPQVDLYFIRNGAHILVDTFTVKAPKLSVDPSKDIAWDGVSKGPWMTFTAKDAHGDGHGLAKAMVNVYYGVVGGNGILNFQSPMTDNNGTVKWQMPIAYAGSYSANIASNASSYTTWPETYLASFASRTTQWFNIALVQDTTPPVITVAAGIDGSTVGSDTLNLTGTVTDNGTVASLYVGFNQVTVLPDGSFMTHVTLAQGANTISLIAYDKAGNKGTASIKVTYTPATSNQTVLVLTIGNDIVSVNGQATSIDAAPEIVAGHTYVPIRFISETFGASVDWLADTQGVTITLGDHTIGLQIGNATAVIDGNIISLGSAPYIKNGRTMVPLRVISEAFGGDVVWDAVARTITITYRP